ncbi:MAG: hypothetical protein V1835_06995, partial [Candidatus Micrarchaeota archaeon]
NLQITPATNTVMFRYQTLQYNGAPYACDHTIRIGTAPANLNTSSLVKQITGSDVTYGFDKLVDNTTYFYNITACRLDFTEPCNSAIGSFATLEIPVPSPSPSVDPLASPSASVAASPSASPSAPPPSYRDLEMVSIDGPIVIAQGNREFYTVKVRNNGGVDERFDANVTATGTNGSYQLYTKTYIPIAIGATWTDTFEWNTAGAPEGNYELKARLIFLNGVESNAANNYKIITVSMQSAGRGPKITVAPSVISRMEGAIIKWETDIDSDSRVYFGITGVSATPIKSDTKTKTHSITLQGLTPGQAYKYIVQSCTDSCTTHPASGTLTFQTLSAGSNSCSGMNQCTNSNRSWVSYQEVNGTCVQGNTTECPAYGCMIPLCNPTKGGCYAIEDSTKCVPQCSGDVLKPRGSCQATDEFSGSCEYEDIECNEANKCHKEPYSCGGKSYFCAKVGGKYEWTTDAGLCGIDPSLIEAPKPTVPATAIKNAPHAVNEVRQTREYDAKLAKQCEEKSCNAINAKEYATDPEIITGDEQVLVGIKTDSNSPLDEKLIGCKPPKDSESTCFCNVGYEGSDRGLRCSIGPPAVGEYQITLRNSDKEGGTVVLMLEKGKKAVMAKMTVPDRKNEDLFWVFIAITIVLVLIATGIVVNNRRMERRKGKILRRNLQMLPKQEENLKYKMMKGIITPEFYQTAMMTLEKNKTVWESDLKEWEKKHPRKGDAEDEEEEGDEAKETNDAQKIEKLMGAKKKEASTGGEIDFLLGELIGKKGAKAEGKTETKGEANTEETANSKGEGKTDSNA